MHHSQRPVAVLLLCHGCAGLAFAGVHDSFWTHAGNVDRMNELLRDAFVELHSRPLLEELKAEFEALFPQLAFPDVPERVRTEPVASSIMLSVIRTVCCEMLVA